jgi:hypothetical protein
MSNQQGIIYVVRKNQHIGSIDPMNIYINDVKVGTLANGETGKYQVSTGLHSIRAKVEYKWLLGFTYNSNVLYLSVAPGEKRVTICEHQLYRLYSTIRLYLDSNNPSYTFPFSAGSNTQMNDNRTINIGSGTYNESVHTEGGNYIQGDYIDISQDLAQASAQIQDLIEQLQKRGLTVDNAKEQVAKDIVAQAQVDPKMRDKLLKWSQSLGEATVSDVVKSAIKLAIRSAGIPLP